MNDDLYDDFPTPREVVRGTWHWLPAVAVVLAAVLVLGGGVTLACWSAGWWFQSHNATRQAEITQNGYSNQTTLRQQVTSQLATVTSITTQIAEANGNQSAITALKAQRMAIAGQVCSDSDEITGTPLPADQEQWVASNCQDGSVSPQSSIYTTGNQ